MFCSRTWYHKYMTLKECIEKNGGKAEPEEKTEGENAEQSAEKKETEKTTIYYVTDETAAEPVYQYVQKRGTGRSDLVT